MATCRELTTDRIGTRTVRGVVYDRFLSPVAERLEETGHWRILRRNGSYCLCLPDNGSVPKVKVKIPDPPELLALAEELHERGDPWEGTAFGWPARQLRLRVAGAPIVGHLVEVEHARLAGLAEELEDTLEDPLGVGHEPLVVAGSRRWWRSSPGHTPASSAG